MFAERDLTENGKDLEITFKTAIEYHMAIMYIHSHIAMYHYKLTAFGRLETLQLNEMLNEHLRATGNQSKDRKNEIISHVKNNLITEDDLPWFDKNNARLCFFIWYCCIKTGVHYDNNSGTYAIELLPDNFTFSPFYSSVMLGQLSPTVKTCFRDTLDFINSFSFTTLKKQDKINYLISLHELHKENTSVANFKWLESEKIDKDWAIDYIKDLLDKYNFTRDFNFPHNFPESEFNNVIPLAFDTNKNIHPIDKYKAIQKLKKAWQQKKYRATLDNKNRKTHQITMSKGIDDKISLIKSKLEEKANSNSELHNKRIFTKNEIIERLIDEEYDRQKNS
ncbi:hypothetical protein [Vibrio sp. CK2-1]|uniref:hypothetical protein n=1 Tax=Vibrio sp. CK2-1 TaxID=2912249 RepID=UPI001F292EF9|nr:hypothetical protein [Vibrio sp. CK2-1]MCF7355546.1 hypothetical protein [Vibrio sp. CK2-1]